MGEAHKKYPHSSFFYPMDNCEAAYELSVASGEEPPTVYAEKGTEAHKVLARKAEATELEPADADLVRDLDAKRLRIEDRWLGDGPIEEVLIEERLWLRNGLKPIYSGQPDRVTRSRRRLFIPDYKTGWHPLDHYTATNCQLRSYVPLAVERFDGEIDEALVAIIKPGKQSPPAVFGPEEIEEARAWALDVVERATRPGPKKPNKGPWCTYCSGKVLCPLWRDELSRLAERSSLPVEDIPDSVLAQLAPHLDLAGTVVEKLKSRLWARVQLAPENFPDWRIDPGDKRRRVEDLGKLYELVVTDKQFISFEQLLDCAKIGITELEATIREESVRRGKKMTFKDVYEALLPVVTFKQNKGKLVYDPKPKELMNVETATTQGS